MLFTLKEIPTYKVFKTGSPKNTVRLAIFFLFLVFILSCKVYGEGVSKNPIPGTTLAAETLDVLLKSNPIVHIISCKNNKVLDLPAGTMNENSPIIFYAPNGGLNQLWRIEKVEKGYLIRSLFSKKVLAVTTEFSKEYSLVVQQDYSGKDAQVWLISGTADSLRILNKAIQKYLGIGQNYLITENYSRSLNQVWKFQFMREAQNETVTCDCPRNFEYIRNLIETSYPGFQDKVNSRTKVGYEQLRKKLAEKAGATKNTAACFKIIDQYLAFFNDNHIQFWMDDIHEYGYGEKLDPNKIRRFYATSETVKMTEMEVQKYLEDHRGKLDRVEGIWQTQDGANRCAIIRDPKEMNLFTGFMLRGDNLYWMAGQVKMTVIKQPDNLYTVYDYRKNHTIVKQKNIEFAVMNTIQAFDGKWMRVNPDLKEITQPKKISKAVNADWFQIRNLDDSTLLLSLPNFAYQNIAVVNNLMKAWKDQLLKTPYLVIDIRGNGGGTDQAFESILPMLYTHPYIIIGNDIIASKENINALEQQDKDNLRSDSKGLVKRMKENPGKFLDRSPDGWVKFNTVQSNPRKIAILINKYCGSSAEEFLLRAKESKKVMMLGQPTNGTLDYSNIIPHKFPNPTYKLKLPLSRTRRTYLVDKEKIKPDFYLTDDQNWMEVAVKQLKSSKVLK